MLVAPSDHVIPDRRLPRRRAPPCRARRAAGDLRHHARTGPKPAMAIWSLRAPGADAGAQSPSRCALCRKARCAAAGAMLAGGQSCGTPASSCFRRNAISAAFAPMPPEVLAGVRAALDRAPGRSGLHPAGARGLGRAPDISIDYAVMEKAATSRSCPWRGLVGSGRLGCGLARKRPRCRRQCRSGPATAIDCTDTLLRSESRGRRWWASG
jgi:mannose-1-phosphate guanylyltransferase / mannose-6-phosphate isomerase